VLMSNSICHVISDHFCQIKQKQRGSFLFLASSSADTFLDCLSMTFVHLVTMYT